ncbi:MAG: hypothetical protein RSF72_14105 [Chryseobacterium sp.]
MKEINGGAGTCPPVANSCMSWCRWTAWQKMHCPSNVYEEPCECI